MVFSFLLWPIIVIFTCLSHHLSSDREIPTASESLVYVSWPKLLTLWVLILGFYLFGHMCAHALVHDFSGVAGTEDESNKTPFLRWKWETWKLQCSWNTRSQGYSPITLHFWHCSVVKRFLPLSSMPKCVKISDQFSNPLQSLLLCYEQMIQILELKRMRNTI